MGIPPIDAKSTVSPNFWDFFLILSEISDFPTGLRYNRIPFKEL